MHHSLSIDPCHCRAVFCIFSQRSPSILDFQIIKFPVISEHDTDCAHNITQKPYTPHTHKYRCIPETQSTNNNSGYTKSQINLPHIFFIIFHKFYKHWIFLLLTSYMYSKNHSITVTCYCCSSIHCIGNSHHKKICY